MLSFYVSELKIVASTLEEIFNFSYQITNLHCLNPLSLKLLEEPNDTIWNSGPHRKTTPQEDNLTGRQPHKKTTSLEENPTGRQSQLNISLEDDLTGRPQSIIRRRVISKSNWNCPIILYHLNTWTFWTLELFKPSDFLNKLSQSGGWDINGKPGNH